MYVYIYIYTYTHIHRKRMKRGQTYSPRRLLRTSDVSRVSKRGLPEPAKPFHDDKRDSASTREGCLLKGILFLLPRLDTPGLLIYACLPNLRGQSPGPGHFRSP